MSRIFLIGDTHFGHENILKFEHEGKPLRPFKTLTEMHVEIIERWNSVVTAKDKVYHLGDVGFFKKPDDFKILGLLNGRKRLIRGNHDLAKTSVYLKYFQEVYGCRQINGVWLTHIPMHENCVETTRVKCNVHGHLHMNKIDHPKYVNVCVEQINYTPVDLEEVMEKVKDVYTYTRKQ